MLSSSVLRSAARRLLLTQASAPASSRAFALSAPAAGGHVSLNDTAEGRQYTHPKIGDREIVGWGCNGQENYFDRPDFPFPAVRFKEPQTPGLEELRQKELGDWKQLSLEDKKDLYRASFCQTFSEFGANGTGEWKVMFGICFTGLAISLWLWMFCKTYVYNPIPNTFTEDFKQNNLRMAIATRKDPVTGISSKWDYENDQWK